MDGFQHGTAEIEPGVQLHCLETGSGPRTMVLVHGYPETWWEWRHVMPLFAAAGFRVIAVDYRGAGHSSKPASGYDKHTMAKDIHALLAELLAVGEEIVLVGHDIGLTVAFAFAALYPAAVGRLVLVDTILPGTSAWQALLTTGKLHSSNLAHFFFHNARNGHEARVLALRHSLADGLAARYCAAGEVISQAGHSVRRRHRRNTARPNRRCLCQHGAGSVARATGKSGDQAAGCRDSILATAPL